MLCVRNRSLPLRTTSEKQQMARCPQLGFSQALFSHVSGHSLLEESVSCQDSTVYTWSFIPNSREATRVPAGGGCAVVSGSVPWTLCDMLSLEDERDT